MSEKCNCRLCRMFRKIDNMLGDNPELAEAVKEYVANEGFERDCRELDRVHQLEAAQTRIAELEESAGRLRPALEEIANLNPDKEKEHLMRSEVAEYEDGDEFATSFGRAIGLAMQALNALKK